MARMRPPERGRVASVRTPAWERLRDGARRLAAAFDAHEVYGGYVAWVEGLRAKRV